MVPNSTQVEDYTAVADLQVHGLALCRRKADGICSLQQGEWRHSRPWAGAQSGAYHFSEQGRTDGGT